LLPLSHFPLDHGALSDILYVMIISSFKMKVPSSVNLYVFVCLFQRPCCVNQIRKLWCVFLSLPLSKGKLRGGHISRSPTNKRIKLALTGASKPAICWRRPNIRSSQEGGGGGRQPQHNSLPFTTSSSFAFLTFFIAGFMTAAILGKQQKGRGQIAG
jgi:hypothetical protein